IASGSRSRVPPIPGLEESGYIDNVSLLNLREPPQSLIIIGGGYIGCEYGHFFSAVGTEVTILGRSPRLLSGEDPEISQRLHESLSRYCRVVTGYEVLSVERNGEKKVVSARETKGGQIQQFEGEEVLLAAGRRSNSDLLRPERTGVEIDRQGWIRVDEYLQTSKKGIWALGDAIGKHMFRHTANYEARIVAHNILLAEKEAERKAADYHAVPYAVFSHPTVAGVGRKESEAKARGLKVLVGRARYTDSAKGVAMAEEYGLAKVVLEEETGRILGASIIGPEAPELIQQVVYLMNTDRQDLSTVMRSQVIHPTINEVLGRAFSGIERSRNREQPK
ncbi:MAG TPA: FAD-dependent oxidoreductase, partial [Methanothrix soehngenii]|nr:FAD-dependent oxidoreductase [Methanothrix soehngenii]